MIPRYSFPAFSALCALLVAVAPADARKTADKSKPPKTPQPEAAVESPIVKPESIARVNVTGQSYDFFRPWSQRPPYQRRAVGPVVEGPFGKAILMTGEVVAHATYVEVEHAESGQKTQATVLAVDYEANLALVQPLDKEFLKGLKPLKLAEARVGETLSIWQLEPNGTLLSTSALLTAVEVATYPTEESALMLYRFTAALQPREGSFTAPIVRDGQLSGMVVRFDSRTQNADAIPAPVISHFLNAAGREGGYSGFPKIGLSFSELRDPQLRRYAGAPPGQKGVYVTGVVPEGPAEKAGIQEGDVLLAVEGKEIDHDGNYQDRLYGKISLVHLVSTHHYEGDKVPFTILRKGDQLTVDVTLRTEDPQKRLIEPYLVGRAPRYYVLGGLILQELSRDYLKEWGTEWKKKAPDRFVYFDQYQDDLFKDDPRERIVILSRVMPSPLTIGYEDLASLVVTEVNGVPIRSLGEIEAALEKSTDGFIRIRFNDAPGEIALDAREVKALEPNLMRVYGLPSLKRLTDEVPAVPSGPPAISAPPAPATPASGEGGTETAAAAKK